MKKTTLSLLCALFCTYCFSQSLADDDISMEKGGYKEKQFFKGEKRVYINSFLVYNEIYREDKDTKQGGTSFGGLVKGSASVVQTLGLSGVEASDLQLAANKLYNDFVAKLKSEGFTIITSEEAGKTDVYKDWELVKGPVVKDAGLPGVLSVIPEGHSYFIRGVDKDGKDIKSKGLSKMINNGGSGSTGLAFSNSAALSKDLDDALIIDVCLSYLFTQEGDNWLRGNGAKIIVKTNFRLGSGAVSQLNDSKSLIKLNDEKTALITSYINFAKGKYGAGSESLLQTSLKKNIYINDVIDSERITSSQSQSIVYPTSFNSYQLGNDFYTDVENRKSTNTNWIEVDSKKYAEGMILSGKSYIEAAMQIFTSKK